MSKYIILRDENASRTGSVHRATRGGGDLEMLGRPVPEIIGPVGAAVGAAIPAAPRIETADITRREAREAERDPSVVAVARNIPIRLIEPYAGDSDDDEAESAWGIGAVGADTSHVTGAGQTVAVLDTGIDPEHPAFDGVTLVRENFTADGPDDGNGHGTHCAGTIFGRDIDGTRIGVARGVERALIGKVLGDEGGGSSQMLFDGLQWAQRNEAQVISMSLGFDFPGLTEQLVEEDIPTLLATSIALEEYRRNLRVFDAIMNMFRQQAAFGLGTVVVAASGNESRREVHPEFEVSASVPAAAQGVISVGAAQQGPDGLRIADFSNTNPVLSGPGHGVVSARAGGGLRTLNGTSMACPHVAGCALLWWEAVARLGIPLTSRAIEARLSVGAATDVFAPDVDVADRGDGLVQAPQPPAGA